MLKLNHKRGYRRLTLVLSLTFSVLAFIIYVSAQYRVDEEDILEGALVGCCWQDFKIIAKLPLPASKSF